MTEAIICRSLSALREAQIPAFRDFSLAPETTFRIGGPADLAVKPENEAQLLAALRILKQENVPFYPVGKCSNLLFDDAGFRGAVVFCGGLHGISYAGDALPVSGRTPVPDAPVRRGKLTAACGESLTGLARYAGEIGFEGLGFAFGIPGSVGGGVCMNAGAYGGEIAGVLESCRLLHSGTLGITEKSNAEMDFSYRHSFVTDHPEYLVLSATFASYLTPDRAVLQERMANIMEQRRRKQPLEYPSAGSVFKRPRPDVYMGKLIEEAGFKGTSVGGAQVSEKHAGFIVNAGGATAADVKALVRRIQDRIFELHGFVPACEIRFIPADPAENE